MASASGRGLPPSLVLIAETAAGASDSGDTNTGGIGVDLANGGTLTNSGTIIGGAGVFLNGGVLTDTGEITGGAGELGNQGAGAHGDAVQFGATAATLIVQGGAVFNGGLLANSRVADMPVLAGTISGTLSGFGSAITGFTEISDKSDANWTLGGTISGGGTIKLGGHASLTLTGEVSVATLAFARAGDAVVSLAAPTAFTSTISGFGTGDVIDLEKLKASSLAYANNT